MFDLTGKTALITGASSGLGERFALTLAQAGTKVILAARRLDKLKVLADHLNNQGLAALALQMDVANKDSVRFSFDQLENRGEKIDICINSAAITEPTSIFESDEENHFESTMQTNVMGVWYVTKHVANHMKNNNIHGSIINIASVNGANRLAAGFASFCASKAAVMQMSKALVGELAAEKIRINCIVPGLFHTPLTESRVGNPEGRKELEKLIPLHFIANPNDLDGAILYLASNKASRYVTGSCMTIDGGLSWGG